MLLRIFHEHGSWWAEYLQHGCDVVAVGITLFEAFLLETQL